MSQSKDLKPSLSIKSAAVSDRGLNEKRPLNEDSFLADGERGIFAVADGVGGAEAGEVASQTAIEVLDEAFRHGVDGADIEDLMELAIQRANASIYQMAQDHSNFSMMATTVVALYVEGNTATIGHVGDSRLYRLTPAGQLVRETEDHSVVEEEVRAGRMTAEQAAHHPSKNVISRALGAESDVEVDMKVTEVEDGTQFLLCTDGITRHIPDHELRQLMIVHDDLTTLCGELKQRCYERGAEDNLTAVVVRVGTQISLEQRQDDLDKTVSPETNPVPAIAQVMGNDGSDQPPGLMPPSRTAFPDQDIQSTPADSDGAVRQEAGSNAGGFGRTLGRLLLFLLFVAAVGAAFYAGRKYAGTIPYVDNAAPIAQASPLPLASVEDPFTKFERARREVDREPNQWLANGMKTELARQNLQNPLSSTEPDFLYLYGRASLLSGNNDEASRAFEAAIKIADSNPSPVNATLKREAMLGLAAVGLKSDKDRTAAQVQLDEVLRSSSTPSPAVSP